MFYIATYAAACRPVFNGVPITFVESDCTVDVEVCDAGVCITGLCVVGGGVVCEFKLGLVFC